MTIQIIDGNNYYRKQLETDTTGLAPRNMLLNAFGAKSPLIWVWDGAKGNERRREKYPEYKRNRPPMDTSIFESFRLLQQVLAHSPAIQVKVPGYEADDVIATLARTYAKAGTDIEIHSNDYDFLQLNAEHRRIFCGAPPKDGVNARDIRLYKTVVGDTSDNIKGVAGFGKKSWNEVDKGALRRAILDDAPFPEMRGAAWADENRALLKTYWEIIGFYDVPMKLIDEHMTAGDRNYAAADATLREFLL